MMYELPPQIGGTAEQQLAALRDYLVRLASTLERTGSTQDIVAADNGKTISKAQQEAAKAIQQQANSLKAIIVKNANEITEYTDRRVDSLASTYVAKSDFGNYYNQIETQVEQTARNTVESYHYTEAIEGLDAYMTELNGQIRRGVIEDPETHEVHLGIAISESLAFTGQTHTEGGLIYYELAPGQTLGLYTSTGWQFWINGVLRGYFSSEDSMLHVSNIVVENRLQLGSGWEITTAGGFGLRYIGA